LLLLGGGEGEAHGEPVEGLRRASAPLRLLRRFLLPLLLLPPLLRFLEPSDEVGAPDSDNDDDVEEEEEVCFREDDEPLALPSVSEESESVGDFRRRRCGEETGELVARDDDCFRDGV